MININLRGELVMVKIHHHNVNTKSLVQELDAWIVEIIETIGHLLDSTENREALVLMSTEILSELQEDKKIYNFKVLCDERNNDPTLMQQGVFTLSIEFRQVNCINVTRLNYTFRDSGKSTYDMFGNIG